LKEDEYEDEGGSRPPSCSHRLIRRHSCQSWPVFKASHN